MVFLSNLTFFELVLYRGKSFIKFYNCEEQIQIKSSTKQLFTTVDDENDIEFENEWKYIKESLLSKK